MENEDDFLEEELDQPEEEEKGGDDKGDDDKGGKKGDDDEVTRLRKEIQRMSGRLNEEIENTRFWHDKAKTGTPAPKSAKKEDEGDDDKLNDDVVEALSSNDPKRIKSLFRSMGFVRKDEVEQAIKNTRDQVVGESELMNTYPELRDKNSEFFKATARHFNDLKADPDFARSKNITTVAARLAAAELAGKNPKTGAAETEDERAARVDRQSGDRGRRTTNRGGKDGAEEDGLNDAQKAVIASFQAVGAKITPESYAKRAKAGVRMGGAPTRRGR